MIRLLTRKPRHRRRWHRYTPDTGALTCCIHCDVDGCRWDNTHPGPCRHCIREMEATQPLPDCLADVDGRCITCAALHGVRITHGRTW